MKLLKENSKVSLLIPCYNGESYLENCFFYVLNQSYNNVEVIIIDDGSTDNSYQIMCLYEKKFRDREYDYKYLHKENGGAASAINIALKYVSGDYIMTFDVDDIIMKDSIKYKAEFLDNNSEFGMVRNNGYYVKGKNLSQNSYLFIRNKREKINEHIFEDILCARTNNWPSTYMIRTDCLFKVINDKSIFESPWGQNMQLMLPVAYFYKTGYIDKPLMRYVDNGNSVSKTNNPDRELELFNGYQLNRMEIVREMNIPETEKQVYYAKIEGLYRHVRLRWAGMYGNINVLNSEFYALKEEKQLGCKDYLNYISGKCQVFGRIYYKICWIIKMARCVYFKIEGRIMRHDSLCG